MCSPTRFFTDFNGATDFNALVTSHSSCSTNSSKVDGGDWHKFDCLIKSPNTVWFIWPMFLKVNDRATGYTHSDLNVNLTREWSDIPLSETVMFDKVTSSSPLIKKMLLAYRRVVESTC